MAIFNDLEVLILQSRTLALEDKQQLFQILPSLAQDKLKRMKEIFEEEKLEFEKIMKDELNAWHRFRVALQGIAQKLKQKLGYG